MQFKQVKENLLKPKTRKFVKRSLAAALAMSLGIGAISLGFSEEVQAATLSDEYVQNVIMDISENSSQEIASQILEKSGGSVQVDENSIQSIINDTIYEKLSTVNTLNADANTVDEIQKYLDDSIDDRLAEYILSIIPEGDKSKFTRADIDKIADKASKVAASSLQGSLNDVLSDIENLKNSISEVKKNVDSIKGFDVQGITKLNTTVVAYDTKEKEETETTVTNISNLSTAIEKNTTEVNKAYNDLKTAMDGADSETLNVLQAKLDSAVETLNKTIEKNNTELSETLKVNTEKLQADITALKEQMKAGDELNAANLEKAVKELTNTAKDTCTKLNERIDALEKKEASHYEEINKKLEAEKKNLADAIKKLDVSTGTEQKAIKAQVKESVDALKSLIDEKAEAAKNELSKNTSDLESALANAETTLQTNIYNVNVALNAYKDSNDTALRDAVKEMTDAINSVSNTLDQKVAELEAKIKGLSDKEAEDYANMLAVTTALKNSIDDVNEYAVALDNATNIKDSKINLISYIKGNGENNWVEKGTEHDTSGMTIAQYVEILAQNDESYQGIINDLFAYIKDLNENTIATTSELSDRIDVLYVRTDEQKGMIDGLKDRLAANEEALAKEKSDRIEAISGVQNEIDKNKAAMDKATDNLNAAIESGDEIAIQKASDDLAQAVETLNSTIGGNYESLTASQKESADALKLQIETVQSLLNNADLDIQDDISKINEAMTTMDGSIASVRDGLQTSIDGLSATLDTAQSNISSLSTRVGSLEGHNAEQDGEINDLQNALSGCSLYYSNGHFYVQTNGAEGSVTKKLD